MSQPTPPPKIAVGRRGLPVLALPQPYAARLVLAGERSSPRTPARYATLCWPEELDGGWNLIVGADPEGSWLGQSGNTAEHNHPLYQSGVLIGAVLLGGYSTERCPGVMEHGVIRSAVMRHPAMGPVLHAKQRTQVPRSAAQVLVDRLVSPAHYAAAKARVDRAMGPVTKAESGIAKTYEEEKRDRVGRDGFWTGD